MFGCSASTTLPVRNLGAGRVSPTCRVVRCTPDISMHSLTSAFLASPIVRSQIDLVYPVVAGKSTDVGGGNAIEICRASFHTAHTAHLLVETNVKLLGRKFRRHQNVDADRLLGESGV